MSAEYVRRTYGVDYKRGDRVRVDGRTGTIVSFPGNYLGVRFDGERATTRCHPTWRVKRITGTEPPFVVHVDDMSKYLDAVYIGRANPRRRLPSSRWSNPHTVKRYGRAGAVERYEQHLHNMMIEAGDGSAESAREQLRELSAKPLACWCRHDGEPRTERNRCHGDVIVAMWKRVFGNEQE